jgi:hypothetical protein
MAATSAQPTPSNGDAELATTDEVKEYCHEGEDDNINSMDLNDIKTELEKDAEESEVRLLMLIVAIVCICMYQL